MSYHFNELYFYSIIQFIFPHNDIHFYVIICAKHMYQCKNFRIYDTINVFNTTKILLDFWGVMFTVARYLYHLIMNTIKPKLAGILKDRENKRANSEVFLMLYVFDEWLTKWINSYPQSFWTHSGKFIPNYPR